MSTTTITITDPELLATLAAADGQIIFRGPTGEHVKTAATVPYGSLPPGVRSPFALKPIPESAPHDKHGAAGFENPAT